MSRLKMFYQVNTICKQETSF